MDLATLSKSKLLLKCTELGITKCKSKTKPVLIQMIKTKLGVSKSNAPSTIDTPNISLLTIRVINRFKKICQTRLSELKNIPHFKIGSITIKYESICAFTSISTRKDNDSANKVRENVLWFVINNLENNPYGSSIVWSRFIHRVKSALVQIFEDTGANQVGYTCTLAAGRTNNYDFLIHRIDPSTLSNDSSKRIEFKFNTGKVTESPQFLSLSSKLNTSYAEFFYDSYVDRITDLYTLPRIDRSTYLSLVHTTTYLSHPWFKTIYDNESVDLNKKQLKKQLVDESIHIYLTTHYIPLLTPEVIANWNEKLATTQQDKTYMLYDVSKKIFIIDYISPMELTISKSTMTTRVNKSNHVHTLVFFTHKSTSIHMLLRWRNHAGVLNPAWQISIRRD